MTSSTLTPRSRIYIAGHRGMVGSAVLRHLLVNGHDPQSFILRSHGELDLTSQQAVRDLLQREQIDYIVLAAAKVGGIHANNTYPAEFIYSNLMIQCNIIHEAYRAGIQHLLFLGSSCIYPKFCPQPMKEEYLLTGELEPTNEPYAVAKIAGIKMCQSYNRQYGTQYRSVMPTNLYGPEDNYHLENSHVIPAMIRKFHLAKLALQGDGPAIKRDEELFGPIPQDIQEAIGYSSAAAGLLPGRTPPKVILWGTGRACREFLHVDDMAAACVFVMGLDQSVFSSRRKADTEEAATAVSFFNVGTGIDRTISETALMIKDIVGFDGEVLFDESRPDGTPKKLLDTARINALGWRPRISLQDGLINAYQWYLQQSRRVAR